MAGKCPRSTASTVARVPRRVCLDRGVVTALFSTRLDAFLANHRVYSRTRLDLGHAHKSNHFGPFQLQHWIRPRVRTDWLTYEALRRSCAHVLSPFFQYICLFKSICISSNHFRRFILIQVCLYLYNKEYYSSIYLSIYLSISVGLTQTLNCIQRWCTISETLRSFEYPFIIITPGSTLTLIVIRVLCMRSILSVWKFWALNKNAWTPKTVDVIKIWLGYLKLYNCEQTNYNYY